MNKLILLIISILLPLQTFAAVESVTLSDMNIRDVIYLPTVRSQYEMTFTKPKTWTLGGGSHLYLEFQHSLMLMPDRSWLKVLVNDKEVKHIALTEANAEKTSVKIPLPVAILKDFNTLTFRVEQHYTDKCEDPVDKSLWTQVLPITKLVFDYTPKLPEVDLKDFPYPLVDELSYGDTYIHYVLPENATEKELLALGFLNVHLAQEVSSTGVKGMVTDISVPGYKAKSDAVKKREHMVYVGTPAKNPDLAKFNGLYDRYKIAGGRWVDTETNQPLAENQGVVQLFAHPEVKNRAVLVVSGNSDAAILEVSRYLTSRPKEQTLVGTAVTVPEKWDPPRRNTAKVPRFIEDGDKTFTELGFVSEGVEKINAPPIIYQVPIVTDFVERGAKLFLDVDYSYSPENNPQFSSLELRMNDVAIANIPLTNEEGELNQQATIPIDTRLLKTNNVMVAQFHLMPDKYGFCVDDYEDKAWGKVLDSSKFRVQGGVASRLPNVGLLNNTGYPYSKQDHMGNTQFVLPENPTIGMLKAFLGITTRLGRLTMADTDLRFTVAKGSPSAGGNLIVIQNPKKPVDLGGDRRLAWLTNSPAVNLVKRFMIADKPKTIQVSDSGLGAYIEQYRRGGDEVATLVSSVTEKGFEAIDRLFEDDKRFYKLDLGRVKQLSLIDGSLNTLDETKFTEEKKASSKGWFGWLANIPWTMIFITLLVIFFILIGLPLIVRLFRR